MYVCLYFIQVLLPSALPRSPLRYVSVVQSLTLFELVCMSLIFYRSHLLPYFSPALTISSLLPLPPPQPLRCMSPPFFFAGLHALYEEQKCVCACMCTWIVQRLSPKAQLTKRLNGQSKGNRELACFYALRISAQFNCSFFFFCLFIHSLFVFVCSHCWVSPYNNSSSFTYFVCAPLPTAMGNCHKISNKTNALVCFRWAFLPIFLGCVRSDLAMPLSFSYAPLPLSLCFVSLLEITT